jgi:hypothetical protein
MLADANIDPHSLPPRLFLPIMEAASLESEDVLRERWAALIANAANPSGQIKVRTAYVEILKQLSAEDVEFINLCYELTRKISMTWTGSYTLGLGSRMKLKSIDKSKEPHMPNTISQEIVDSVQRLGIIAERDVREASDDDGEEVLRHEFYITTLGVRFIEACRPPGSRTAKEILDEEVKKNQKDIT